jgi:CHAT domain
VRESNGGLAARLFRSSVAYPGARDFCALQLNLDKLPRLDTSVNVQTYGATLRTALSNHPAIGNELTQMFYTSAPNQATLRFMIAPNAERLRWETLFGPPSVGFLALKDVCAMSRVVDAVDFEDPGLRTFRYPLQMTAFLSPAGVSAVDEFEAICAQVMAARTSGLAIECRVYLGEQDLLDDADRRITGQTLRGITALPIPSDSYGIENALKEAPAELVHFFCHGMVDSGVLALELATINDRDKQELKPNDPKVGSIKLSADRLTEVLGLSRRTWVTVLNSCSGATPVEQLHSMALTIAAHGSPFAIGMAEPITSVDATAFSKAFYARLFDIIKAGLAAPAGSSIKLDLARAVIPARRMFHDLYSQAPPDAFGRWCLPVVYQQSDSLTVLIPAPDQGLDAETKQRIDIVARALQTLPPETPNEVRDKILETLDHPPKVAAAFRPNRNGLIDSA